MATILKNNLFLFSLFTKLLFQYNMFFELNVTTKTTKKIIIIIIIMFVGTLWNNLLKRKYNVGWASLIWCRAQYDEFVMSLNIIALPLDLDSCGKSFQENNENRQLKIWNNKLSKSNNSIDYKNIGRAIQYMPSFLISWKI